MCIRDRGIGMAWLRADDSGSKLQLPADLPQHLSAALAWVTKWCCSMGLGTLQVSFEKILDPNYGSAEDTSSKDTLQSYSGILVLSLVLYRCLHHLYLCGSSWCAVDASLRAARGLAAMHHNVLSAWFCRNGLTTFSLAELVVKKALREE